MALPSPIEVLGKSKGGVNFNSFLQCVAICALVWVGTTVTSSKDRLSKIEEELAVRATKETSKWEQLDRIESEVSKQRDGLRDLQIDVSKLKSK